MTTFNPNRFFGDNNRSVDSSQSSGSRLGTPLPLILIHLQDNFSFLREQVNPLTLHADDIP
ncbi:MAG: hypothetical protein WBA76_02015 [Phormidesmis sp.]